MIGRSIAPGISRSFASEEWEAIPTSIWKEERKAAFAAIDQDCELKIFASDLDPKAVKAAQQNAEEAGVDDCIVFRCADIAAALPAVSSKNQDTGRNNRCTAAAVALDAAKCGERENVHRTGGAGLRSQIPNHAEAAISQRGRRCHRDESALWRTHRRSREYRPNLQDLSEIF